MASDGSLNGSIDLVKAAVFVDLTPPHIHIWIGWVV